MSLMLKPAVLTRVFLVASLIFVGVLSEQTVATGVEKKSVVPFCAAKNLTERSVVLSSPSIGKYATGLWKISLIFTNHGTTACSLSGAPKAQPVTGPKHTPVGPNAHPGPMPGWKGVSAVLAAHKGTADMHYEMRVPATTYPVDKCAPRNADGIVITFRTSTKVLLTAYFRTVKNQVCTKSQSRGLTITQAVAQVLADFAGTPVRNITVRSLKLRDGPTDPPWLTVEFAGVDPNGVEATWLDVLAPEAVANLMSHDEPTTQAAIGGGQQFNSPSDDVLRSRIHDAAQKFGLEVRALTILHPLDSAVSVSFTVPDNAMVSWTIDQLRAAVEGSPRTLEGSLIQLYSTSGELLLSSGCAYRTGLGGLSFAPGQDERFAAMHGHPAQPSRVISTP
jgi:hypothetical protein